MPLLGKKAFALSSNALPKSPSKASYLIEHTGETFSDKVKYEQVVRLYNQSIWTCQCTGKTNLTHEEARKSEELGRLLLNRSFHEHLEKPVLQMIHHDTRSIDCLAQYIAERLEHELFVGDRVDFNVTSKGKTIWGTVISAEPIKAMKSVRVLGEATSVNNLQDAAKSKKVAFQYSVKLSEDKKIINSVPAEDLVRVSDRPSKNVLKQFIKSSAIRCGASSNSPWVVNDDLVTKHSLTGKLVELLIPLHMVNEDGSEFRKRKVENVLPPAKKLKLSSCQGGPKKTKKAKVDKSGNAIRKDHEVSADVEVNGILEKNEVEPPYILSETPKKSTPMKTELKLVLEDIRMSPDMKLNRLMKDADGRAVQKSKLDTVGPKLNKAKMLKKKKLENAMQKNVHDDAAAAVTIDKDASTNSEKTMSESLDARLSTPLKSKGRMFSGEVLNGHSPKVNSEEKRNRLHQLSTPSPPRTPKNFVNKVPAVVLNGYSPRQNSENKINPLHQLAITPSRSPQRKSTVRMTLDGKLNVSPYRRTVVQPSLGVLKEKLNMKMDEFKNMKLDDFAAKCARGKYPIVRLYDCMLSVKKSPTSKTGTPKRRSPTSTISKAARILAKGQLESNVRLSDASCSKSSTSNAVQASWNASLEKIFDSVINVDSSRHDDEVAVIDLTCDSPISFESSESEIKDVVPLPTVPVKKVMKQMTLFDMKMNGPAVIGPKKDLPSENSQNIQRVPVSIDLNLAIRAIRQINTSNAYYHRRRLADHLKEEEIASLPPDVKVAVMSTKEKMKENKIIANMTETQKQEYFAQKRAAHKIKIKPRDVVQKPEIDDKCVVNPKPLPIPTMVPTPDNIPNELFGDVAMIVEFFNIYKEILMPEKLYPVTPDLIMTALSVGKDGFRYISNILMIALNVLIQDDCTQGFKELQIPLLDLQLDINVAPELTRMCLKRIGSKELLFQDVANEALSLLENSELYELEPHLQLQVITCVCNLVLSTAAVKEYMDAKRAETKECWIKQMDVWVKNKELKASVIKENVVGDLQKECVAEDVVSETIENLQSDGLVVTIRKRRQALSRKSLLQERDSATPKQKVETPQKSFLEEISDHQSVVRVKCLGMDRNYSRYWVFPECLHGLYVERGWATDCDDTQDAEDEISKDTLNDSIPTPGQNLWFSYKSADEIEALLKGLDVRGCREKALRRQLVLRRDEITKCLVKKRFRGMEFVGSDGAQELIESFRKKLETMESKLRKGNLGSIQNLDNWIKKLSKSETCEALGECLVVLHESIYPGLWMPLPAIDFGHQNRIGTWKEIVASCNTLSRLHVLFGILDARVKWEKSTKNVKCNICRKKEECRIIVTCSECSRAYHAMCLRPMLKAVPEEDWQCTLCMPRQMRPKTRKRYGNESDDDDEDSEKSDESAEDEDKQCVVCDDGDNDKMVTCAKCDSSYHIDCHVPNLCHLPRTSNWECNCCRRGKNRQARRKIIAELRSQLESTRQNTRILRTRKPKK